MGDIRKQTELVNYMTDMKVMQSHLAAANVVAAGAYKHNPVTHEVPCQDDLGPQIQALISQVDAAHTKAAQALGKTLRESSKDV